VQIITESAKRAGPVCESKDRRRSSLSVIGIINRNPGNYLQIILARYIIHVHTFVLGLDMIGGVVVGGGTEYYLYVPRCSSSSSSDREDDIVRSAQYYNEENVYRRDLMPLLYC